jgi:hypothetical protein
MLVSLASLDFTEEIPVLNNIENTEATTQTRWTARQNRKNRHEAPIMTVRKYSFDGIIYPLSSTSRNYILTSRRCQGGPGGWQGRESERGEGRTRRPREGDEARTSEGGHMFAYKE